MNKSLVASLLAAVGGWGVTVSEGNGEWAQLMTPLSLFGLLAVIGAVLGGRWSGKTGKGAP